MKRKSAEEFPQRIKNQKLIGLVHLLGDDDIAPCP